MSTAVAVGGNHVTMDIARGLSVSLADAERLKTLYGACVASPSDERETIVDASRRRRHGSSEQIAKSELVRIIRPRVEEILELVRDRLAAAGFARARRPAARADRRRVPTDRPRRSGPRDRLAAGADGPAARRRGPAGIGQEPRLRRGGRPDGLSAGGRASSISSRDGRSAYATTAATTVMWRGCGGG